ncbi:actin-domain-containing protein [Suillus ampliporus]|nr:actin-domain-containing protein [Suillus ampliporus]
MTTCPNAAMNPELPARRLQTTRPVFITSTSLVTHSLPFLISHPSKASASAPTQDVTDRFWQHREVSCPGFNDLHSEECMTNVSDAPTCLLRSGPGALPNKFFTECIKLKSMWILLKPHVDSLVANFAFPQLTFNASKQTMWETNPIEYIRASVDGYENFSSPESLTGSALRLACEVLGGVTKAGITWSSEECMWQAALAITELVVVHDSGCRLTITVWKLWSTASKTSFFLWPLNSPHVCANHTCACERRPGAADRTNWLQKTSNVDSLVSDSEDDTIAALWEILIHHNLDFIGDEALANAKTPGYGVHYPIRHGIIDNWDHMEQYWEQTIFKYLRAELEDHYFLLENREQTAEIFFELFNIKGLYTAVQAVLALAASWTSNHAMDRTLTGTIIDLGDGVTHVIPCVEGYVIGSAIKHIPIAGHDISQFVLNLMFPPEDQLRVASRVKENYSYACQDIVKEFRKYDAEPYKYFERYGGEHSVTGREEVHKDVHLLYVRVQPVLIVGAGSAGLVAALTLFQNGMPVRIIDKDPNPRIGQRGPGIWPCSLELFSSLNVPEVNNLGEPIHISRSYKCTHLDLKRQTEVCNVLLSAGSLGNEVV